MIDFLKILSQTVETNVTSFESRERIWYDLLPTIEESDVTAGDIKSLRIEDESFDAACMEYYGENEQDADEDLFDEE